MFITKLLRRFIAAHVQVVRSNDGCEYLISFDQMGTMPVVVTPASPGTVPHAASPTANTTPTVLPVHPQ